MLDYLPFDFLVAALLEGVQDAILEARLELDLRAAARVGLSYCLIDFGLTSDAGSALS